MEVIENLQTSNLQTANLQTENLQTENCSICLTCDEKDEKVTCNVCQKEFHKTCILPWLETKTTCPMCKQINTFDLKIYTDKMLVNMISNLAVNFVELTLADKTTFIVNLCNMVLNCFNPIMILVKKISFNLDLVLFIFKFSFFMNLLFLSFEDLVIFLVYALFLLLFLGTEFVFILNPITISNSRYILIGFSQILVYLNIQPNASFRKCDINALSILTFLLFCFIDIIYTYSKLKALLDVCVIFFTFAMLMTIAITNKYVFNVILNILKKIGEKFYSI